MCALDLKSPRPSPPSYNDTPATRILCSASQTPIRREQHNCETPDPLRLQTWGPFQDMCIAPGSSSVLPLRRGTPQAALGPR